MAENGPVVVFGASGFVGAAVATRLARSRRVVSTRFRSAPPPGGEWLELDLRDPAAIDAALSGIEPAPAALVHCAGTGAWLDLPDVDGLAWQDAMDVTARAFLVAAQWFAARGLRGSRLVAVTGMPGLTNVPAPAHIAAANAALTGLVHALSGELGEQGISVTAVMLGPLDGGVGASIPVDVRADYERFSSLRRCASASEAAEIVAFALDAPRSLTGTSLVANGGL